MLGSVPVYGLCTTHVSGESSRYPGMASCVTAKALSYGLPRQGLSEHFSACQSGTRLANICRFCSCSHKPGKKPLYRRSLWRTIETSCICARFHNNRSLPIVVSMGKIPKEKGSDKTSYSFRLARQYTSTCHSYPWKSTRCHYHRLHSSGSRGNLYNGSWLHGLFKTLQDTSVLSILYYPFQKKFAIQTSLLTYYRQNNRSSVRSSHCIQRLLCKTELPRKASANSIFRCRKKQTICLYNKQFHVTYFNHSRTVSMPMAS